MKNLALLMVALFLTVTLSACATTATNGPAKVKCPACGYEFNPDAGKVGSQ